jgi:prolipoprotein diacylglyceryltransferase
MEFTLLGAVVVAYAGLWGMFYGEGPRGNAIACARSPFDAALGAAIAGLFAGRIASMVAGGINPLTNPGDVIIVRAGVATGPATVAAIAAYAWLARGEIVEMFDAVAPAALAGLAGWHAGCLVRGTCLGTQSDLPWAINQPGSDISRHPVEVYAALLLLVAAVGLAWWKWKGRPPRGMPAGIALAAAGAVRLATEPMRAGLGAGPVWWYAAAVVTGLAVAVAARRAAGSATSASARGDG